MLSLPPSVKIFVARAPVDMRKSFDGLSCIVCDIIQQDPCSGHLFLFVNKRRNRAKIIWWEESGYWLLYKRLERGQFPLFDQAHGDAESFTCTSTDLMMILDGIDLRRARRREKLR